MNENMESNIDPLKGMTSDEVGPEAAAVERLGRMGKNTYDEKMGAAVMIRQRQKLEEALQAANLLEEDVNVDEFLNKEGTSVEKLLEQYEETFADMNANQLGALVRGMTGDDGLAESIKSIKRGETGTVEEPGEIKAIVDRIRGMSYSPAKMLILAMVAGVLLTPPLSNTAEASDLSNIISGINFSLSAIKQYENGKRVPVDSLIDEILQNKVSQGLSSKDRQSLFEASRVIRNAGLGIVKPTNGQPSSSVDPSMGVNQPVTQAEQAEQARNIADVQRNVNDLEATILKLEKGILTIKGFVRGKGNEEIVDVRGEKITVGKLYEYSDKMRKKLRITKSDLDLAKKYLAKVGVGNSNYANAYESQQKSNDAMQKAMQGAYAREQSRNDQQWEQTQKRQKLAGKVRDLKIELSRLKGKLRQAKIDHGWSNSNQDSATVKSLSVKIPKAENELAVAEESLKRFNKKD